MTRGRPRKTPVLDRTKATGNPLRPGQVSVVLPPDARAALAAAAAVDPGAEPGASPERVRALEQALRRVQMKYPTFFK